MEADRAMDVEEDAASMVVDENAASMEDDDGEVHDNDDGQRDNLEDMVEMWELMDVSSSEGVTDTLAREKRFKFCQFRLMIGLAGRTVSAGLGVSSS